MCPARKREREREKWRMARGKGRDGLWNINRKGHCRLVDCGIGEG